MIKMDEAFRKVLRPVDARGKRGVYSRGKPNYGGLMNAPNPTTLQELAKKRLKRNGNIASRTRPPSS